MTVDPKQFNIPVPRDTKTFKTVIISKYAHGLLDDVRAEMGERSYKATLERLIILRYHSHVASEAQQ